MNTNLVRFQRALLAFQRITHFTASLQLLVTFLEVASEEGRTQVELARALELVDSTTSRQLIDLGPFDRKKAPGFQLVDGQMDPMDMRIKRYVLTPRGRATAAVLHAILEGKHPAAEIAALEAKS